MRIGCSIDQIERLKPEELEEILERDRKGEYVLVDVRQPQEYVEGHIPGAKLLPLGELEERHGELDRDKKIVTYCRSGHRSMGGAILLCGLGFKNIYTMDGGMLKWNHEVLKGLPEERPKLITGNESVGDVLMIALKLERGSQEFYKRIGEKALSQRSMATFQRLACIEMKHAERIYDRYLEVLGRNVLPPFDSLMMELRPEYMEGGIEVNEALLRTEKIGFRDEMEVLEAALEKEYLSYDFYKRVAGMIGDADTRTLLHELAGEERSHINSLLSEIGGRVEEGPR